MRTGSGLLVVAAVMMAATGCGDASGSKNESDANGAALGPKVTVIDAGRSPRKPLRLEVEAGEKASGSITMDMALAMSVDGRKAPAVSVPTMTMGMTIGVSRVRPNGVIESSFSYDDAKVGGSDPSTAGLQEQLDEIAGVTGRLESTDTGAVLDSDIDIPRDASPLLRSTMQSFDSQMQNMAVPFPQEAVGVGARWKVTTNAEINGLKGKVTYTYTLASRTADGVELDFTMSQVAPEQDPDIPGMPAGAEVHLDEMTMSGKGHSVVDLASPFPVAMTSSASGGASMSITSGSNRNELIQDMDVKVVFRLR